ncbi:hypothetical protein L861_21730 [Litchfieldella anticariensis FP35 = DSM 16096]|uniref:Uncharacterized protein n=1 Tax=Litchfieldella anticariensis (strain DSM 16096 / CECT 5854 / CIP 108499 / LMG 22089 / FP35) TaxID=1121939 RepID=S2LDW7_LITA3|nr:hypothetical protein L861_21730 [Halomonas anticariensis FP35 = DSM 16096]
MKIGGDTRYHAPEQGAVQALSNPGIAPFGAIDAAILYRKGDGLAGFPIQLLLIGDVNR